jgi:hypothetical protein
MGNFDALSANLRALRSIGGGKAGKAKAGFILTVYGPNDVQIDQTIGDGLAIPRGMLPAEMTLAELTAFLAENAAPQWGNKG